VTPSAGSDAQKSAARGGQSITRAVAILRVLAKHTEQGGRLSQIARETKLHVATCHRILSILAQEGLVTHDPITKIYQLGLELYRLGSAAQQFSIRGRLRGALENLAEEIEDTVFLMIRSGNDSLCVDRVEGRYPIRTVPVEIGSRRPLGFGPGSLALIAFLPEDAFEKIVQANKSRYLHYKLRVGNIRDLAAKGRQEGYVLSDGVFHQNVVSLGVPIFNRRGEVVCAISVSAIRSRMDPSRRERIARLIKKMIIPLAADLPGWAEARQTPTN